VFKFVRISVLADSLRHPLEDAGRKHEHNAENRQIGGSNVERDL
jgi:hypothetical protein